MPSRATRAADQMTAEKPDQPRSPPPLPAAGVSDEDIAKMIKATAPKAPKFNARRQVAAELVKVAADMVEGWNPSDHEGVTRDDARTIVVQRLSYSPAGIWDDRLGERSTAGRRSKADDTEQNESE